MKKRDAVYFDRQHSKHLAHLILTKKLNNLYYYYLYFTQEASGCFAKYNQLVCGEARFCTEAFCLQSLDDGVVCSLIFLSERYIFENVTRKKFLWTDKEISQFMVIFSSISNPAPILSHSLSVINNNNFSAWDTKLTSFFMVKI